MPLFHKSIQIPLIQKDMNYTCPDIPEPREVCNCHRCCFSENLHTLVKQDCLVLSEIPSFILPGIMLSENLFPLGEALSCLDTYSCTVAICPYYVTLTLQQSMKTLPEIRHPYIIYNGINVIIQSK